MSGDAQDVAVSASTPPAPKLSPHRVNVLFYFYSLIAVILAYMVASVDRARVPVQYSKLT
jgi:hypothetical protein